MIRVLIVGALSLSLAQLAGCMHGQALPERALTVSGCPVVTACILNPAAPQSNGDLSDDNDYLLSAWAECAAKVDTVIQHSEQQPRADP